METTKVRWGILGPGIIAHQFAQDFEHVTNAELVAVASRSKDRANTFADQYQVPKRYSSYDLLYQDPDIDCIYIATPHNFHYQQTIEALKAGKAVLCEKPITVNYQECEKVVNFSAKQGKYLAEGMWTYFLPAIMRAKDWIKSGSIGSLKYIKSEFGYPVPFDPKNRQYDPELAGGVLLDMGIYTIAMAWLFEKQFPKAIVSSRHNAPNGVDDDMLINFQFEKAKAVLHSSFLGKLANYTYLIGDKGTIAIPDFWRAKECHLYEREQLVESFQDHRKGNGFEFEIQSVSQDLIMGKQQSEVVDHQTSLALQRLMHDAFKKA